MRTVFSSSSQAIHVWAQQTQSKGKSSNIFFERATVYSYGYHYPLGIIATNKKGEKAAIINNQGYSVTTSKHISEARQAVKHYSVFLCPNTETARCIASAVNYSEFERIGLACSEAIERRIGDYYTLLCSDTKKRKAATLEKWNGEALAECGLYIAIADWFKVKLTPKAKAALRAISGKTPEQAKQAAQKAAALEAKRKAKEQAEQDKRDAIAIAASVQTFLAGENLNYAEQSYLRRAPETVLRIKGDDIETSKGAKFPINHAVKAFAVIQAAMQSGKDWQTNGKTLHLGSFKVDKISACGDVTAGCHFVKYAAIEQIAKQLKLA